MKTHYFKTRSAARAFAKANGLSVKDAAGTIVAGLSPEQMTGNDRWYVEDDQDKAMTLQQLFDKMVTHLLEQNTKSIKKGVCLYRGPNETMCAVGCLIKDEFYSEALECQTVDKDNVIAALAQSGVPTDRNSTGMMRKVQRVHDNYDPCDWAAKLRLVATNLNLSPAVIK